MNPYNQYVPPYMQPQAQPIQTFPQRSEPKVVTYFVNSAEQMSGITPMPNTIYLGITHDGDKIFTRVMNNDGLMETKAFSLIGEQKKKTDTQEILSRLEIIERKLGVTNEPNVIDVTQ